VMVLPILAAVARADGLPDPLVGIGGVDPGFAPQSINIPVFTISDSNGVSPSEDPNGNPIEGGSACVVTPPGEPFGVSDGCFFQNDITMNGTGQFIDALNFDVPVPFGNDTCPEGGFMIGTVTVPSIFSSCVAAPDGSGGTVFSFSGGIIPYQGDFFVSLDFPNNPDGVSGTATAQLPEPGTFSLLGIGLLALLGINRKRLVGLAE
jgi:hypothetical protein